MKDRRKQSAFRIDPAVLKTFQMRLFELDLHMSPVLVGWIDEYLAGRLPLPPSVSAKAVEDPPSRNGHITGSMVI